MSAHVDSTAFQWAKHFRRMVSLELLLRASAFTVLDLNEMGGTMMPREAKGESVWAGKLWLVLGVCPQLRRLPLKNPAPHPKPPSFHSLK